MKKAISLGCLSVILLAACNPKEKEQTSSDDMKKEQPYTAFNLSNLDTTASPCDNFYQYAIGGWLKANPIPSTESRWSSFNIVNDSNNLKLKTIMEDFSSKKAEKGSMEQKIGDFYTSIMDSTHSNEMGITPLQGEITKIKQIKTTNDLIQLLAEFQKIGVDATFGTYVGQDDKHSDQYITYVSQSGLGLPDRDYYTKDDKDSKELQEKYRTHIAKLFDLAGDKDTKEMAQKVYAIEAELAQASMTKVERRKPENTYNKMSVKTIEGKYPNLDWKNYFETIGLIKFDSLIVSQPHFFMKVNGMLKTTPIEDWKTYLKFHLINSFASSLSEDFEEESFHFYGTVLSGTKEMKPRWKRALGKMNSSIGQLVGKAFVEQFFSKEAKIEVSQLVENLRTVFRERINKLEWMSEDTKKKAIEKLEAFGYKIGYPAKWRNYDSLEITPNNMIQNIINSRKFNYAYMVNKLGKDVDPNEWFMNPQTVNAYYSSSKNEVVFPAGILQPPFYSVKADDALNYGGIGAVIGHEFTHGFDDQGSKYDGKGNLKNWWTEQDRKNFMDRAQKVVEQFNGFESLDSLFVNGELTLGENIADLGGVTLAFHALEKAVQSKDSVEKIDGFTYQQRFFLGWAQVWHMNMTDKELRKRVTTDPHSPGEYRVNGPLSNMSEFAEAFGCKSGSKMIGSDSIKAVIW